MEAKTSVRDPSIIEDHLNGLSVSDVAGPDRFSEVGALDVFVATKYIKSRDLGKGGELTA